MNEQIFTPLFRAAFQSLVTYEIPSHETKSEQPEIFQLAYEDAYDNAPAYYNLKF